MSARDVIADWWLSYGEETWAETDSAGLADAILSALRSAGFAPPLHTGAIHKALQDAFQAGVNEAFAGRYIRPSSDLVALKHKLCDAALNELLKAAQEDRRTAVKWQPIETAPKDGRWVLIYGGKSIHDPQDGSRTFECICDTVIQAFLNSSGKWEGMVDGWTYTPTHWHPLPPPPEVK